jgi:plasmid maintenance system antidote protein VapI
MAMRLSFVFGASAQSWLNHQMQFDLWKIPSRRRKLKVRRVAA